MGRLLFLALAVLLGGVTFASVFGAYLYARAYVKERTRLNLALALVMGGMVLTKGIILFALLESNQVDPTAVAWGYFIGAGIQGLGAIGLIHIAIEGVAAMEGKAQ